MHQKLGLEGEEWVIPCLTVVLMSASLSATLGQLFNITAFEKAPSSFPHAASAFHQIGHQSFSSHLLVLTKIDDTNRVST